MTTRLAPDQLRATLRDADPVTPQPYDAVNAARLLERARLGSRTVETSRPPRRRRPVLVAGTAVALLGVGGVAVATLRPPGEVATPPMAPPVIVTGTGSQTVPLPPAPAGARYARIMLACFDATRCGTPGGSSSSPRSGDVWVLDALPLSGRVDPDNAQKLTPIDPARGVAVDVSAGGRWRLYAVYVPSLNPELAPVGDGRRLGIPGNGDLVPELVPAATTSGDIGWIRLSDIEDRDPGDGPTSVTAVGADAKTEGGSVVLTP